VKDVLTELHGGPSGRHFGSSRDGASGMTIAQASPGTENEPVPDAPGKRRGTVQEDRRRHQRALT
jgi:hypothetical protein